MPLRDVGPAEAETLEQESGAEGAGALELGTAGRGMDNRAEVDGAEDTVHREGLIFMHGHLGHLGHIGAEGFMHGQTASAARTGGPGRKRPRPAGHRHDLVQHRRQPRRIPQQVPQIGRASWRGRVEISVVAASLQKQNH